jgi:hypothetical protein
MTTRSIESSDPHGVVVTQLGPGISHGLMLKAVKRSQHLISDCVLCARLDHFVMATRAGCFAEALILTVCNGSL